MARLSVDEKIKQVEGLNLSGASENDLAILKHSLGTNHNRLVATAAKICGDNQLYQFCPNLKQSFHYFATKPEKDKGCFAKTAIVETLYQLDHCDEDFYALAIGTRQLEPVWGGSVDTAVEVRCWSAYSLTLSPNARVILLLLELLHDPEPQVRLGAVKAIANTNPAHAEIFLREKVLDGDKDTYVIGECLHQLVAIEPEYSLDFVKRFLDHDSEEWVEYAALAIAECAEPAAFNILKQALDESIYDQKKKHLIKAIALHRSKSAVAYLLELLESAGKQEGQTIVEALSIHRSNDSIREQVKEKIITIPHCGIMEVFKKYWGQK